MEAQAFGTTSMRAERRSGRVSAQTIVRTGLAAGLVAGLMMAMWQMIVGAVAQNPTAVPGIDQRFWTPVTAITSSTR